MEFPSLEDAGLALGTALSGLTAALFFGLSRARGDRFFHPDGRAYDASYVLQPPASFRIPRARRRGKATVRLSRGASVPRPLPDVLGLAVRLLDVHGSGRDQDFLLVTSAAPPVLRHALLPALGFSDSPYSSILPYRAGKELVLFGARFAGPAGAEPELAAGARVEMLVAPVAGAWRPWGHVDLEKPMTVARSRALRFNPWNTGAGIKPEGLLNAVRRNVYPASQAARSS